MNEDHEIFVILFLNHINFQFNLCFDGFLNKN